MLVICYGIAKSGSTLAFELVRGVLQSAGHDQKKLKGAPGLKPRARGNHLEAVSKEDIGALVETIGQDRIVAVKTHKTFDNSMFGWVEDLQRQRKLQAIVSYRDPRDMCLSLLDHGKDSRAAGRRGFARIHDLDDAARIIKMAIAKFAKWGSLEGALRLYFETVAFAPDEAIDAIERTLGVTCDHEAAKQHAFEDAFTQRNKARRNRYLDEMTEEQKTRMLETFGPFIARVCHGGGDEWYREFRGNILAGESPRELRTR